MHKKVILFVAIIITFLSCGNVKKENQGKEATIKYVLTEPYKTDKLDLQSRVIMAPMTRCRADNTGHIPTDLMSEYYAQRASAGLIITEMAIIAPNGYGFPDIPGIYTPEQIEGWRNIATKVHEKGGKIFMQIAHNGWRYVDPLSDIVAPSAIPFKEGAKVPRALTKEEINKVAEEFGQAAQNAIEVGFDGIEVHAANGYLINQFLAKSANKRTDEYGGSIENRSRFLFEVLDSIATKVDLSKVAIRISPSLNESGILDDDETQTLYEYIVKKLNDYNLAYLHISGRAYGTKNEKEEADYILDIISVH